MASLLSSLDLETELEMGKERERVLRRALGQG